MSTAADSALAAVLAILGAATTAWGTARQQRSTLQVPEDSRATGLVWALAHRAGWWVGILAIAVGFVLYAVSLSFGALALVQPLMVVGLVLGPVFSARLARRRLDRRLLGGGLLCCLGLATFLVLASPEGGDTAEFLAHPLRPSVVVLGVVLLVVLTTAGVLARAGRGLARGLALATATGVVFGTTATLVKLVADQFGRGVVEVLTHWPLWALCVLGPAGFLVSQYALRYGRLLAPVNAVISTLDPVVAVVAGVVALREHVTADAGHLAVALLGAVVTAAGIVVVSRRSARMLADHDDERDRDDAVATWG